MSIITNEEREYLLTSMSFLLTEYNHPYHLNALNRIIDKWAAEKRELIKAFKKHPNYLEGKFMIAFDVDYDREFNTDDMRHFSRWLEDVVIPSFRWDVPEPICNRRAEDGCRLLPRYLYDFLTRLHTYSERNISTDTAIFLVEAIPEVKVHKGEKMSRVVNKICKYLGYDNHPDYNREFAKYADAINPMTIKRHTVLSINPLDYLTMSFGNSWASCHTIDKKNKRDMPNSYEGQYCSGTISYMLDSCSMVLYTVDPDYDGNEYWDQPKINRQMFHWGEDKLVQGRLYPQGCDGNASAYAPYRQIVQQIMSIIFDFDNLWTLKKGTYPISDMVLNRGTHYTDYFSYDDCTISKIKSSKNRKRFIIGAEPMCIECGSIHKETRVINCCLNKPYKCECCGRHFDEEEIMTTFDGHYYCSDCAPNNESESA